MRRITHPPSVQRLFDFPCGSTARGYTRVQIILSGGELHIEWHPTPVAHRMEALGCSMMPWTKSYEASST